MMKPDENFWSEFEYSKLKLLINQERVTAVRGLLHRRRWRILPPISVELHLTDLCNLRCPWCTDRQLKKNRAALPTATVMAFFDYLAKNKVGVSIEGGGEPTLHPQFTQIVEYGAKRGVHMGLITNGVRDCSAQIPLFRWVRVSLDAATPREFAREKGRARFHDVTGHIAAYARARRPGLTQIGVGYVITKRNISHIPEVFRMLDRMGVDYLYLRPVEEARSIAPEPEALYDLRKRLLAVSDSRRMKYILTINDRLIENNGGLPCAAHLLSAVARANGEVALCEKRRHDPIVLGNLNEDDFERIWRSPRHRQATRRLLAARAQQGCAVCRMTSFNSLFSKLDDIRTGRFI